jgi:hypothetical protein
MTMLLGPHRTPWDDEATSWILIKRILQEAFQAQGV